MTVRPNLTEHMGEIMSSRKTWHERYPERFKSEKESMEKRGFTIDGEALKTRQRVAFDGCSRVDPEMRLRIEYGEGFPSFPPRVFSKDPHHLLKRHHRPGSLELCLFGPNQSRWSATLDGTAAIDEAEEVILLDVNTEVAAKDIVPEPWTEYYDYAPDAAFLVPPPVSVPVETQAAEQLIGTVHFRYQKPTKVNGPGIRGRGVILDVALNGRKTVSPEPFLGMFPGSAAEKGCLVFTPDPPPYAGGADAVKAWLAGKNIQRLDWMFFVFPEQCSVRTQSRLAWLAARTYRDYSVDWVRCFCLRPEEREARIPGLGALREKKALLVGAGSLGSRIACALAAAGVRKITLIDPDFYDPLNAVRHEVGITAFGINKSLAVIQRVIDINPLALDGAHPWAMRVGDLDEAFVYDKLEEEIGSSDILINSTGSHAVTRFLDETCHDLGVPAIHASVTNGAWSGEIVRIIPGRTACWRCWNNQYETCPPPGAPAPGHGVFAPGCGQPTFTGTGYETAMVANLAAWVTVETLLMNEPGRAALGGDYVRWSLRNSSGYLSPSIDVLPIEKRVDCPLCGG